MITNDRGDVLELLDASGAPFTSYRYDAWGNPSTPTIIGTLLVTTAVAGSIATRQPLKYAGYVYDPESGLYALGARSYDPRTAQFISCDPACADGEESPYQYCGGDPIGKIDPTGLIADWSGEGQVTTLNRIVHSYHCTSDKKNRARLPKAAADEASRERRAYADRERNRRDRARLAAIARDRRRADEARMTAEAERESRFEIVSTPVFGLPINHVYVRDTWTWEDDWKRGTNASQGVDPRMTWWGGPGLVAALWSKDIRIGNGGGLPDHPPIKVRLPEDMDGAEFKRRIDGYPGWNKGQYCFFANDCHTQLQAAFERAGVPYPGAPDGRIDQGDPPSAVGYAGMYGVRR